MKVKKLLLLFYLFVIFSSKLSAQGEGNFWFFGNNAGLDFNSGAPVALTVGALNTSEGCAAISDHSGNLLFYTDGVSVWNKLHATMPDGTGLLGDPSSTQSGIIVPKPGSSSTYYIFTTAAEGAAAGLCYTEVDMTLDGGLGNVVTTAKNISLLTPVDEKITAVKNSNNVDFWVIAQGYMTGIYYVYAVTSAGVTTTAITSTAGTPDGSGTGVGYLKSSSDGSKLVSAASNNDNVDILDFDNTTGAVTFDFNFAFHYAYGVEFSPDGTKLYVVAWGGVNIYQYDMTLGSSTAIIASGTNICTSASLSGFGALQNAPDGKMYASEPYSLYLGAVTDPNTLGIACGYVDTAVYLAGRQPTFGLPNFITSFFRGSPIDYVGTCVGDTTFFSLIDSIVIDSIRWNFGDTASGINNTSSSYASYHIFSGIGTYTVTAITHLGSVSDTSTVTLQIIGAPVIFIGNDTAICAGDSITINAGSGYTYLWQDGSTNQTFRAAAGGTYYLTATGRCGSDSDTIRVTAISLPLVRVNDTSICIGRTAHLNVHGADSYTWSSGVTILTDSTVTAAPAATTNYYVTGTTGTCSAKDTATVTVKPLPVITVNSPAICIGDSAILNASGAATYAWSTGGTGASIQVTPVATTSYTVTGTSAMGCVDSAIATVTITPIPVVSLSADATIVAGSSTTLLAAGGTGYNWSPSTALSCSACANPVASPVKTTEYCVIVDNGLCVDTGCVTVNVVQPCPDATELQVPDAFSPNNDGNNDEFLLQAWNACTTLFSVVIYDRWGEKVFESANANFKWDGNYKGRAMDPGVFIYFIKAKTMDGLDFERKGNITLIR